MKFNKIVIGICMAFLLNCSLFSGVYGATWTVGGDNLMSFNSVSSNPLSSGYDEDAYPNALNIYNELKKLGQNVTIANSFDDTGKSNLMLGDLVQYRVNSSDVNRPMYKYFLIKNDTGDEWGIDTIDLIPRNVNGDKVEKSGEDIAAIHVFQHDRIYIPKSAITADNSKYTLHVGATGEWRVNELYTAYGMDCTQLYDRLNKIPSKPYNKHKDGEKNIFDDIQKHNQNPYPISI
ncbi:MAG: hypothetical protein LBT10_08075 [Methanobrevibacter sp.]|jgi:hypothetical protein|nr:hypothetical protein [Methanobrevibacter sp.]